MLKALRQSVASKDLSEAAQLSDEAVPGGDGEKRGKNGGNML